MQIAQIICLSVVILINGFLLIFHNKGEGKKPLILTSRIIILICSIVTLFLIIFK